MAETTQKKTLKLKKPGGAQAPAPGEGEEAAQQKASGMPPPATMRPDVDQPAEKSASYTVAAICGLVAVLCLAALLALQAMENAYYADVILKQPYVAPVVPPE